MKGYIDRLEDNRFAVIIVEEIKKEFVVPKEELPKGSNVGDYFEIKTENEKIVSLTFDENLTKEKRNEAESLMLKIKSRKKESKFKKNKQFIEVITKKIR